MIKKFNGHPKAQCYAIIEENRIILISYTTKVAEINGNILHVNGLYSATTRKHIGYFMKEYAKPWGYSTAKILAETGEYMNITTGEVFKG